MKTGMSWEDQFMPYGNSWHGNNEAAVYPSQKAEGLSLTAKTVCYESKGKCTWCSHFLELGSDHITGQIILVVSNVLQNLIDLSCFAKSHS